MFVLFSVHYPQLGQEAACVQKMRHFDELIRQQPGILFVSDIFPDPEHGTLVGFTFWESEAAWQAAWPGLVEAAPSPEGERQPAEVQMFMSAD